MAKSRGVICDPSESKSVSCRKIDNGYIVSESSYQNGQYKSSERYSAEKPKLEFAPAPKPRAKTSAGPSSLARAIAHTKRK